MNSTPTSQFFAPLLARIDEEIIRNCMDAELILRERRLPHYEILPAEARDAEIVAAAGGLLVHVFVDPVAILENPPDA